MAHPRSGSHFLREILNQHARVFEAGEVFNSDLDIKRFFLQKASPDGQAPMEPRRSPGDPDRPLGMDDLDGFMSWCGGVQDKETIGVTLFAHDMGHSLSDAQVAALAGRPDILPIFLIRKNLLKTWISFKRALTTRAWHLDGSGSLLDCPIDTERQARDVLIRLPDAFDLEETRAFISATRRFFESVESALKEAGKPYLTVYYEDLCLGGPAGTDREIGRVLDFLGVEPLPTYEIKRSQTASAEFYDAIPNREELVQATGYDLDPPPSSPQGWVARTRVQVERWKAEGRTVALAPAGRLARSLMGLSNLQEARFIGYFDRAADPGATCDGHPVHPYADLAKVRPGIVLVASPGLENEIVQELQGHGCPAANIVRLSGLPPS